MDKKILRAIEKPFRGDPSNHPDFVFWCPGCKCGHGVWTTKRADNGAVWSFNGNLEKPTFQPSILIRFTRNITDEEHARIMAGEQLNIPQSVCHSYVTDGKIQFLGDCTHALAGQTIPLEEF